MCYDSVMSSSTTVIRPKRLFHISDLKEIWNYRELLYFFSWRDLKVRYKQTIVGVLWSILQPFITMVVFSFFFGTLAKVPSDNVPYPIFVYTGLLFWQFFSDSVSETSMSLTANKTIITKVYFPRVLLPISSIVTKFVDFAIAACILIGLMFYYGYTPNLTGLLILPLLLLLTLIAATGLGLFLAAVNVKYRDVRYALPFFIQLLLFVTPVIYPASIAGAYSKILALNPMMGVIQSARAALLQTTPLNWTLIVVSLITGIFLIVFGIAYFKKTERYFADII